MCTKPHPLIVYRLRGEDKNRTKFFRCYPDEIDPECECIKSLRKYVNDNLLYPLDEKSIKFTIVPCGQCYQCRLQYSRVWANRCVCESITAADDSCFFLTLTYDNDHVDSIKTPDGHLSLNFYDLQNFMKRLRAYYDYHFGIKNIRFYAAGEYGDQNLRPHFHVLLYNCPIPDKEIIAHNKFGDALYTSDIINEQWGFGFTCIGELNWNTCAYTARYVMKKIKGVDSEFYDKLGITPEAVRMSLKPGIGYEYLTENLVSIYREIALDDDHLLVDHKSGEAIDTIFNDKIILPSNAEKPNIIKPPRYFDKVLERTWPSRFRDVKHCREIFAAIGEENRKNIVMKSDREYFHDVEYSLSQKQKGMYRKFLDLC